jgi:hypothetical protein
VRRRRPLAAALLAIVATTIALGAMQPTFAAFASSTQNPGNIVTAANDFVAPAVSAPTIGKSVGGATGFLKQGGGYFVYANVAADTGNPPSGIGSVVANVNNITSGQTAVPLTAGTYTAGGASFNYKSAALTANAVLAEGAPTFTVTATDKALNAATATGAVTVDNAAPKAADVQTTNAGTNGLAEQNDSLLLSFNEPIEPESVLAGWTGAATSVVVRVNDNGLLGLPTGNDTVQIYNAANTAALPLGSVDLGRSDYAAGLLGGSYRFGATGTPSTMTMSGNTITVVLGTYNSTIIVDAARTTAAGTGTMVWTPVATPYDRAANPLSTVPATESGAADKEF